MVERLSPLFQIGVLFRRTFLALRAIRYLRHVRLMAAHCILFFRCSLHTAFQSLDKERNPYGETPYSTLDLIARRFGILSSDLVIDLGSGRGLATFWWAERVKCKAVGVDQHAAFIARALWLQERLSIEKAHFIEGDFLKVDLSMATVIYLYGTTLSDEIIGLLIARFAKLDHHVKIITVSYSLSEFSHLFRTLDEVKARLPWGKAVFYLNQRILP